MNKKRSNQQKQTQAPFASISMILLLLVLLSFGLQSFSELLGPNHPESIEWSETGDTEQSQEEKDNKFESESDKYLSNNITLNQTIFSTAARILSLERLAEKAYRQIIDPPPEV